MQNKQCLTGTEKMNYEDGFGKKIGGIEYMSFQKSV